MTINFDRFDGFSKFRNSQNAEKSKKTFYKNHNSTKMEARPRYDYPS